jgi:molybdopterin molybdotransferase
MAIGRIASDEGGAGHHAVLFGLPGNPVAVMVTFYALVRDALLAMSGATAPPMPLLRAASVEPIRKKPGRTEYQRGIVTRASGSGEWQVRITGSQGSGILRSMSEANGLVVLAHEQGNVEAGEFVDVLPFDGLI